jgi:putative sigma-54 modulation protein
LKGTAIICKNQSPDMYVAIDAGARALQRKLVKYKERRTDGWHGGGTGTGKANDDFIAALEGSVEYGIAVPNDIQVEDEAVDVDVDSDFIYSEKPKVVKVDSFQLDKSVSIDEAIFALDYVDHDFYVFRNEKTNEINVVYKRHHGGIGLIEP